MPLVKCKSCGIDVSHDALACPKCGARIAKKPMGCGGIIMVVILGMVILSTFSSIFSSSSGLPADGPSTVISQSPEQKPKAAGSQWTYQKDSDPMAKGVISEAFVKSTNTVEFAFPYSGAQRATLTLRKHPRFGTNVIFNIEKGQLQCPSYKNCMILVRFDDHAAEKFTGVGPSDNSSETAFINNESRFIGKMKKAKRVRLAVSVYQQGEPTFDFDVTGFNQAAFDVK